MKPKITRALNTRFKSETMEKLYEFYPDGIEKVGKGRVWIAH